MTIEITEITTNKCSENKILLKIKRLIKKQIIVITIITKDVVFWRSNSAVEDSISSFVSLYACLRNNCSSFCFSICSLLVGSM